MIVPLVRRNSVQNEKLYPTEDQHSQSNTRGAAPKLAQAPDGFRPIFLEHLSSRLCQPMTYQPTAVQLANGWSEDGQADRRSKEIVGGHTLGGLRRQGGEGFGYAVFDGA